MQEHLDGKCPDDKKKKKKNDELSAQHPCGPECRRGSQVKLMDGSLWACKNTDRCGDIAHRFMDLWPTHVILFAERQVLCLTSSQQQLPTLLPTRKAPRQFSPVLLLIVSYCRFIFAHGGCVSRRAVIFFLLHRQPHLKGEKKAVWAHADLSAAPLLFHTDRQTRLFLTVWSCSCLIYWLTSDPGWAELDGLLALLLLQLDTRILMWSVPRACLELRPPTFHLFWASVFFDIFVCC